MKILMNLSPPDVFPPSVKFLFFLFHKLILEICYFVIDKKIDFMTKKRFILHFFHLQKRFITEFYFCKDQISMGKAHYPDFVYPDTRWVNVIPKNRTCEDTYSRAGGSKKC